MSSGQVGQRDGASGMDECYLYHACPCRPFKEFGFYFKCNENIFSGFK